MVKYCSGGAKKRRRRGGKKKGKSGKKSGKRRSGSCRAIDPLKHPNWFHELPLRNVGDKPRNLKQAYAALGIDTCRAFKSDVMPCRYMPMDRVRTYAGLCKLPHRSGKSKAQLCAALARKTHKRAVSKKCQLQRVAQVYGARYADGGYMDPRFYSAKAMHQILKAACINPGKNASRVDMGKMILTCVKPMHDEKKYHAAQLAGIKHLEKQAELAIKDPQKAMSGADKKSQLSGLKKATKESVKLENERHKNQMKALMQCGKGMAAVAQQYKPLPPLPGSKPSRFEQFQAQRVDDRIEAIRRAQEEDQARREQLYALERRPL